MLAFLGFLSWQSDSCPFVSRVSQIAHSHRDITLLALLSCIYSFFRALLLMLTGFSVTFFADNSQICFSICTYWPCPGSPFAVPDCLCDILGLNWCHSNFLRLVCSLKSCLSITFMSVFLFFCIHQSQCKNLSWFPLGSVTNINKLLVLHHGSLNSNQTAINLQFS